MKVSNFERGSGLRDTTEISVDSGITDNTSHTEVVNDGCHGRMGTGACFEDDPKIRNRIRRIIRSRFRENPLFVVAFVVFIIVLVVVVGIAVLYGTAEEVPLNFISANGYNVTVVCRGFIPEIHFLSFNSSLSSTSDEWLLLKEFLVGSLQNQMKKLMNKTRYRDVYVGLHVINFYDDVFMTFEFALTFHGSEIKKKSFLKDLTLEFIRLGFDGTNEMELGIFILDKTSFKLSFVDHSTASSAATRHETIAIPVCTEELPYNVTCYPNILGHRSQEEAAAAGLRSISLLDMLCSHLLTLFWCSIFTPDCTSAIPLPPCRSLCQAMLVDCPNLRPEIYNLIEGGCHGLPEVDASRTSCTLESKATMTDKKTDCRPVDVEECRSLGFELTPNSNLLGQSATSSDYWWRQLETIHRTVKCSPHLMTFGCSVFYPKCPENANSNRMQSSEFNERFNETNEEGMLIVNCEDICKAVQKDCGFFFSLTDMTFLADYNCSSHLSQRNNESRCIDSDNNQSTVFPCQVEDGKFSCEDDVSTCISGSWICDGRSDCPNGKDEVDCSSAAAECLGGFLCSNGSCVALEKRCDGVIDCAKAEDELNCIRIHCLQKNDVEGLLQIYNTTDHTFYPICLKNLSRQLLESVCNYNRFEVLYDSHIHDAIPLSILLRNRSNCALNQPLSIRCNYSDCTDGPSTEAVLMASNSTSEIVSLDENDWPWMVSLHGGHRRIFYCSGFLVADRWVVTSAHCVARVGHPDKLTVMGGQSRRTSVSPNRQQSLVSRIHVHPQYSGVQLENDVALLRLSSPVQLTAQLRSLCLPADTGLQQPTTDGRLCYVGGWGKISNEDADFAPEAILRRLTVRKMSLCDHHFESNSNEEDTSSSSSSSTAFEFLCTTGRLGSDVCQGDSGSAVLCESSSNGRLMLSGIVSKGTECGNPDVPSIQTSIGPYVDWIHRQMISNHDL